MAIALAPCPEDDVVGAGPGRELGRTVMGHARLPRVVRLLHQASSSDRAGAGSSERTSPVQDTHRGQSFSGSRSQPPAPARDHHRTAGQSHSHSPSHSTTHEPARREATSRTGTANLTSKDGTAHHLVDGQEPTHNRSVAGSRPASPTQRRRSQACGVALLARRSLPGQNLGDFAAGRWHLTSPDTPPRIGLRCWSAAKASSGVRSRCWAPCS